MNITQQYNNVATQQLQTAAIGTTRSLQPDDLNSTPNAPTQQGTTVTISKEALQLLENEQTSTAVSPNSAGGTTLPPLPPKEKEGAGQNSNPIITPQDQVIS